MSVSASLVSWQHLQLTSGLRPKHRAVATRKQSSLKVVIGTRLTTSAPAARRLAAAANRPVATRVIGCDEDSTVSCPSASVRSFDFLVLGSGIAGLSYALKVAEYGSVAIVTKAAASEGCTRWAQGGISAVLSGTDSPESHIQDTLVAGDFLNDRR